MPFVEPVEHANQPRPIFTEATCSKCGEDWAEHLNIKHNTSLTASAIAVLRLMAPDTSITTDVCILVLTAKLKELREDRDKNAPKPVAVQGSTVQAMSVPETPGTTPEGIVSPEDTEGTPELTEIAQEPSRTDVISAFFREWREAMEHYLENDVFPPGVSNEILHACSTNGGLLGAIDLLREVWGIITSPWNTDSWNIADAKYAFVKFYGKYAGSQDELEQS